MSEINVSLIQDEDVLRRMWQQTEDFSKKKEIRTHMYRLREERLRNLYSPEPKAEAKGCEFTSSATHVASFADQNFQSMKSKEVRDAGSPPKEFTYRGQDLKEYSNAGWNVESEDSTQDGGATRVKALHATVEGRYDVEGGAGRFAAADSQRRARTELHDDRSSIVRDETSSSTAARDHLVRTAPDGTHVTSSTSSSTTSNMKQVSETRTEPVPYVTEPDRDTNTDERITRITNRNDYEQNTRRTDIDSGDLVSRKVEYPDDNTKVIVETRRLPDGTRVTSTRREFRVPSQQTYHSHSKQHRAHSDTRQSSSTTTHRTLDDRTTTDDIVDTQRNRDDTDFRRQIREHTATDNDDHSALQRTSVRCEHKTDRNVSDYSQTDNNFQTQHTIRTNNEVVDRSTSDRNEYTRIQRETNERMSDDVDETKRRREVVTTTRDDRIPKRDVEDIPHKKNSEERVRNITKDDKVEKVVERKTTSDRYQTTYQTDYQQRKVSEELSPTHQAWASTLRSDTPSTTRPSTRASSPGSRTFQSSTSSLRSSVSPDKHRKPSSRGASPSKIDRSSPTRTLTSDRYSDTQSTYSVTETKTNKYTSPERRPPTGQRPSTSPEKRPFRPSQSPERKPTQFTPERFRSSPTRMTPPRSPTRPRQSPEKPIQSQYPRTSSPSRTYTPDSTKYPEASPERDIGYRKSPDRETQNYEKRPSTSPDRKPGYMRPTAASHPTPDTRRPSRPGDEPDRTSKHAPTSSPDRKKTTKVVEDHYKFVDEETKVNIRNQNVRTDTIYKPIPYDSKPRQKSPSPKRQTPKDSESSPTLKGRMPQKDKITITENDEMYGRIDKTIDIIDIKETDDTIISKLEITRDSPGDKYVPQREPSPPNYDTYDKKKPRETITTKITTESIDDSVKHDSVTRPEKVKKAPEPLSPTKKGLRDVASPTKSPTKDVRYKHTTDIISTEKNIEEINYKTVSKNRPRQLSTPSSSPTRKLKAAEPEPSTGQSSPTTSVSGFVYFGSPRNERPLITDLDDESDNVTEPIYDRPDTLDVKRSPTPSKIPCRSPSPEQRPSLPKDGLPRKSSLKKTSAPPAEPSLASPMEKPPTSFRVSPTEDKPTVPDHKVVKKDQPVGSPVKPKPPLQRRETYEDRCRKILGMVEDTTAEMITKETINYTKRTESQQSSQSVSPCDSPTPKETSSFPEFSTITTKVIDAKTDVTDFISREIDENIKTTKTPKKKTPSRESSPTKLQDIISNTTSVIEHDTQSIDEEIVNENEDITRITTRITPNNKVPRQSSTSPEKITQQTPTPATRSSSPTKPIPAERTSVSPTRKPSSDSPVKKTKPKTYPIDDSPTRKTPVKTSVYSTTTTTVTSDTAEDFTNLTSKNKTRSRILESPNRDVPASKPRDDAPKYRANEKPRKSPEKSPTRTTTRKVVSSELDTNTTERTDITKTTKTSVSPTRKSPQIQPRELSPTKSSPTHTPKKPSESSAERKPRHQTREPQKSNTKSPSPIRPNQTTASSITKHVTITGEENIQETITSKRTDRKHSSSSPGVSPTYKSSEPRTPSPTKSTRPTNLPKKLERSPERKPSHQSLITPSDKHPATKSPSQRSPDEVPGYMKTTTSTSSKFETTSVTDVRDTFTSVTDKKHTTTRHTGSPRTSPDRGTHDYRSGSPLKPSIINERPSNRSVSPDNKPKDSTTKIPGYMRPTEAAIHKFESTMEKDIEETSVPIDRSDSPSSERSVSLDSAPKIPGYMRPTEAVIHKFDSNMVTDVQETITSRTVRRKSPEPSHRSNSPSSRRSSSPDHKPKDPISKTPGYMRPTEAVIHKHDSTMVTDVEETVTSRTMRRKSPEPTERNNSPSSKRSVSPDHKPKDSVSKTPGYMRPTEAAIHKYDFNEVTDLRETITSKTVRRESPEPTDRSNSPSSRRSVSPDHKPKNSVLKTPGYMRPTEAVIHKHDSTMVTDVEETITSRTMRRKSPEPTDRSNSPSSRRSVSPDHKPKDSVLKTPGYMRPTEAVIHKHDSTMVTDVEETITSRTMRRKSPEPTDRSNSPSSRRSVSPDHKPKDSVLKTPGYMRPTEAVIHKHDSTMVTDVEETITSRTMRRKSPEPTDRSNSPSSRRSVSPDHKPKDSVLKTPGYMRPTEAVIHKHDSTMVTDVEETITSRTMRRKSPEPTDRSNSPSSRRSVSPDHKPKNSVLKTPGYMRPTEALIHKFDTTVVTDVKETVTSEAIHRKSLEPDRSDSPDLKVKDSLKTPGYMRPTEAVTHKFDSTVVTEVEQTEHRKLPDPADYPYRRTSPERKIESTSPVKDSPTKPGGSYPTDSQLRSSVSPDRKPSQKKPTASKTSKFETRTTTEDLKKTTNYLIKPEETRQLRTPSPIKKTTTQVTDVSTEFILSEKEQEILDKVQKSLRKLSPDRKEKSPSPPSRERTPNKSTLSLEDLDIITTSETEHAHKLTGEKLSEVVEEHVTKKTKIAQPYKPTEKSKDHRIPSKPTSRNASPTKKTPSTPAKSEKSPDSPTKSRSISPKKPFNQSERPQSPKVSKVSGIKQREPLHSVLTRKPTPATIKIERLSSDIKRANGVTKQTITVKTSTTSKITTRPLSSPTRKTFEPESKRTPTTKGIKEPSTPKKETVTRTTSDNSIKPKKTSPQRMRSKPEIQISDMSPKSLKSQKPSKFSTKPKSATALNTSLEEEDFIVDLQQSKSSRENSPDRICPTPVNFTEDVGTPRFPDEVSEPDDEYRRRTYHTIHETESVVDDIVEICEDEELFIKKTDRDISTEEDDSYLSVTDKVNKFTNKIESVKKPKDTFSTFKDTERRVHSDFITENLKSDECLLSVSEKVNKFVKGPRDLKDNRSPTKRIVDEYDKDTIYQDDYTKLSVNDKAHLFVETAENIKVSKPKPAQKVERPDLSNVDESLKSDECLLSVSDKVNKFVKTAEQFMTETTEVGENENNIKEQHERIMKQFVDDEEDEINDVTSTITTAKIRTVTDKPHSQKPKTISSKVKDFSTPKTKPTERTPTVKITTLRSSEAVKKAKALFENIASTQTKEVHTTNTTKLTDIGVINKSSKTDSTTVLHPSVEDISPNVTDGETEIIYRSPSHKDRPSGEITPRSHLDEKPRSNRLNTQSPEVPRSKSPMRQTIEVTSGRTVLSRYPAARAESPSYRPEYPRLKSESDKQVPGYLKPTKTSQLKEETKVTEESEVSTRRGSGKFGVELRRTSVERSTVSSERRRSVDHHQPCIEDIYDLDLLEQMLEKVTGYEQRRRIRAQIRIVKKESEHVDSTNTYTNKVKQTTHVQTSSPRPRSPERQPPRSPERSHKSTSQKTASPDRLKSTPQRVAPERNQTRATPYMNGHAKEPAKNVTVTRQRPASPEKSAPKYTAKSPVRHPSPEKKRTVSPSKITPKQKPNRFNEYASAYMKKIQINENDKVKLSDMKSKKIKDVKQTVKYDTEENVQEFTTTKSFSERASSKDVIEVVQVNGKRSSSPEKRQSPVSKHQSPKRTAQSPERNTKTSERKDQSPERLYQRTPSPDFKRPRADAAKETVIKSIYDIDKKIPKGAVQEEKPSWVTNRNLKKITSETRTFSSKKIETEKPKYRAASPSKVIVKPTDVITSSYGPGPLDADGKPLFGIKALRNGATNFQVKGTVIRQEYHSRNGGEPEGTVSVTAYSSQPEDLQQLLADQSVEPPSRLHGLAAITTTKKFGGDTGNTYSNVHTKEERASLEQFTHTDRKIINNNQIEDVSFDNVDSNERKVQTSDKRREEKEVKRGQKMERREDKKNVRQSSVKSLTEKFIKSTNDTGKVDRSSYPKAGLILRTTTLRDSVSSDDAPGLHRTDSEHSLNDEAFEQVESKRTTRTTRTEGTQPGRTRTTVTETSGQPGRTTRTVRTTTVVQEPVVTSVTRTERSFLDSNTKVTGVQDILTRMKNADIVIQEGDSNEDQEARALLNKFLGATVLMAGMQGYVSEEPTGKVNIQESSVRSSSAGTRVSSSTRIEEIDLDHCWDEQLLRKLLDECTDYEQRRRLRARIRSLMAEQEACANAVTEALGCAATEVTRGDADGGGDGGDLREEEEVTVTSSVRRDSTEKTISSSTTTKTSKVLESMTRPAPKPVSPFAKFRQLEKQNSTTNPNSPKTPQSPGSPSQPYFKFTDPALQCSALTIKERLLQWCRDKTRDYENVKLENFSTSWADGLAFCALVHHFLPDAFDYSKLTADKRRHNFTLAFKVADEKAGIYPLLDVDDMVAMRKPDWKCVFTYVQSIYRRFKDER